MTMRIPSFSLFANDDGQVDIADSLAIIFTLYQGGGDLRAPYPEKGTDPTTDDLTCENG